MVLAGERGARKMLFVVLVNFAGICILHVVIMLILKVKMFLWLKWLNSAHSDQLILFKVTFM